MAGRWAMLSMEFVNYQKHWSFMVNTPLELDLTFWPQAKAYI